MTPVTLDQLARMYSAANQANSRLSAALCAKPRDRDLVERLRERSSTLNSGYDAARRAYKRQQKSASREALRTSMIRFYLDLRESGHAQA